MVKIDGKTAVSVCNQGENNADQYALAEELYGYVEDDFGWTRAEDTPFSDAFNETETKIA